MNNGKVWIIWINNGLGWDDKHEWIVDIRNDNKENAEKIGKKYLEKFFKEHGITKDERKNAKFDTYAYANYNVEEFLLNQILIK